MINNLIVSIVMPAYNAEKTLKQTYAEIPHKIVDHIILVDDCSSDLTIKIAKELGIKHIIKHDKNLGYGANQKTCYNYALKLNSDIIIMLHPDYQYSPKLITAMVSLISEGIYKVVFGSRILGSGALKGGMPIYKYISNRILTFIQNIFMNNKLSEYHTGYRAYSTEVLKSINYEQCSNDFIFDNQIIAQILHRQYFIAEISCPTKYFKEASSIKFIPSIKYGLGCLYVSLRYRLHNWHILKYQILGEKTI